MHRFRRGFTLVELLIVIIVTSIVATIAILKTSDGWRKGSESQLREDLHAYRVAVERFRADTGYYPATLSDLRKSRTPSSALDDRGHSVSLRPKSFQGPYLSKPKSPPAFPAYRLVGLTYDTETPTVGRVYYESSLKDSRGVRFRNY